MKNESVGIAADRPTELAVRLYRSRVLIAIGFGLCCAAGLLLTAGKELNQAAYVDPYIYAGYIHDYPALLARFGTTYYSERIAFIYPERLLTHLFRPGGRLFCIPVCGVGRSDSGGFCCWVALLRLCAGDSHGCLARIHALAAAVPVLDIPRWGGRRLSACRRGVPLGSDPKAPDLARRSWRRLSLAVDCNLFLLLICGLVGPGWAFFYRREGINWLARAILALAVGFFATYLALALLFYLRFPAYGFSFELRSIQEAITELGGKQKIWYAPLSSAIWEDHDFKLLIPVTLLLATFAVIARRSATVRAPTDCTDFGVFAVIYLASIICLFLLFHFGLHGFVMTDYAYTVFALPSCVLALIVLGGEAERRGGRIFGMPALYGGSALMLLWWLAYPILPHLQIASSFYFWVAVAVATVTAAIASRRIAVTAMVLIGGTALLSLCLYQTSYYQIRTASPDEETTQWDIYHGGIFLQQFVNANIQPSQASGFWYTGDHEIRI